MQHGNNYFQNVTGLACAFIGINSTLIKDGIIVNGTYINDNEIECMVPSMEHLINNFACIKVRFNGFEWTNFGVIFKFVDSMIPLYYFPKGDSFYKPNSVYINVTNTINSFDTLHCR